jgi:hypothetical protein
VDITGNVDATTVTVTSGSGGDGYAGTGGDGGSVTVGITGNVAATTVTVTSGSNGPDVSGGTGGDGGSATFTADTLKAGTITLKENDADLIFHVDTLDVTLDNTKLTLDGTDAGHVTIDTIELDGKMLTVDPIGGGVFSFDNLEVSGTGATYQGYVDPSGKTITFDLTGVAGSDTAPGTMLNVDSGSTFTVASIVLTGTPSLHVDQKIILLHEATSGTIAGLSDTTYTHIDGQNEYLFTFKMDGNDYVLTLDNVTNIITITPVQTTTNNNGGSGTHGGVTDFGLDSCVGPVVHSVSATPVLGGALLAVDAWGGDGCALSYQWQIETPNGWINIVGATGQNFNYTELPSGDYHVRCMVRNSAGEMISVPVTFIVA